MLGNSYKHHTQLCMASCSLIYSRFQKEGKNKTTGGKIKIIILLIWAFPLQCVQEKSTVLFYSTRHIHYQGKEMHSFTYSQLSQYRGQLPSSSDPTLSTTKGAPTAIVIILDDKFTKTERCLPHTATCLHNTTGFCSILPPQQYFCSIQGTPGYSHPDLSLSFIGIWQRFSFIVRMTSSFLQSVHLKTQLQSRPITMQAAKQAYIGLQRITFKHHT